MNIELKIKEYIQPFERQLAFDEVKALTGVQPKPLNGTYVTATIFSLHPNAKVKTLLTKLAYWEEVNSPEPQFTDQIFFEASASLAKKNQLFEQTTQCPSSLINELKPKKRRLRYGSHGLHEYRGKYFPQLVKALMNRANVPDNGIVLDPMCGSGTTIVEAIFSGRKGIGFDMNPLSSLMAEVKCSILKVSQKELINHCELIDRDLQVVSPVMENSYFSTFSEHDQKYLRNWFPEAVLKSLDQVMNFIQVLDNKTLQNYFCLILSNILRRVSFQKLADLRVRKEEKDIDPSDVFTLFSKESLQGIRSILALQMMGNYPNIGEYELHKFDARKACQKLANYEGLIDATITSPPYATALPYLDTDRLSLIYLGLLPKNEHRKADLHMIGNREINERLRQEYINTFEENQAYLPKATNNLISEIHDLNNASEVGFRRKNMSALLSKYFRDMKQVIEVQHRLLKPNGHFYMVVGNNRTTAGGKEIEIQTAHHLSEIAKGVGFHLEETINMEMLSARDLHRKNSMNSEVIICLSKC